MSRGSEATIGPRRLRGDGAGRGSDRTLRTASISRSSGHEILSNSTDRGRSAARLAKTRPSAGEPTRRTPRGGTREEEVQAGEQGAGGQARIVDRGTSRRLDRGHRVTAPLCIAQHARPAGASSAAEGVSCVHAMSRSCAANRSVRRAGDHENSTIAERQARSAARRSSISRRRAGSCSAPACFNVAIDPCREEDSSRFQAPADRRRLEQPRGIRLARSRAGPSDLAARPIVVKPFGVHSPESFPGAEGRLTCQHPVVTLDRRFAHDGWIGSPAKVAPTCESVACAGFFRFYHP